MAATLAGMYSGAKASNAGLDGSRRWSEARKGSRSKAFQAEQAGSASVGGGVSHGSAVDLVSSE